MKTKHYFFLMLLTISLFSMAAKSGLMADNLVGTWKYMISDVPAEYQTGSFVFEQKDNNTIGYVQSGEKNEIKELTENGGKVTFMTDGQAGEFKYSFTQKGDTLSGTVSSQYGEFAIVAVKQAK
jgi:lipocalin